MKDYDANSTVAYTQISVGLAARQNLNGGVPAILTWAVPLVLALAILVYLLVKRPWNSLSRRTMSFFV